MSTFYQRLRKRLIGIPVKQPPNLIKDSQRLINQLSEQLDDGDFIAYWNSDEGQIGYRDSIVFNELLRHESKHKKLYLFIKSSGGSGESSLRILHLLRQRYDHIVALAPLTCASAATMLALGANEIRMGPLSYLTAVDTSITHLLSPEDSDGDLVSVNQNELDRVLKLWNKEARDGDVNAYKSLYKYIHPLVFGAVDRASSLSIKLTSEILGYHMEESDDIQRISEELNSGYPSHGYPINQREAEKLGIHIASLSGKVNDLLIDLSHIYSKMAQRCVTDHSLRRYHNNRIYTIVERADLQFYYKLDRETTCRRFRDNWINTGDESGWRKNTLAKVERFHIK